MDGAQTVVLLGTLTRMAETIAANSAAADRSLKCTLYEVMREAVNGCKFGGVETMHSPCHSVYVLLVLAPNQ